MHDKKALVAIVLVLLVGGVAAVFFMMKGDSSSPQAVETQVPVMEQTKEGGVEQAMDGVGEWIAGLAAGKRMECEYRVTGEDGTETSVKMYAERDRYRTEVGTPQGNYVSISDGKAVYSFLEGSKEGMKMELDCMKDLAADLPDGEAPSAKEQFVSSEETIGNTPGISCRETGAVDIAIPSDVRFTDQCALLRQQTELMKQYQEQMPELPENVRSMMGQ